jgi:hypothetical protein
MLKKGFSITIMFFLLLLLTSETATAQTYIETDVQMNNIDNLGATYSLPLPYVSQVFAKMSADENGDWYVTTSEASSFLANIDENYMVNLSMDEKSLKYEVNKSFIMDFKEPRDVLINYVICNIGRTAGGDK